MNRIKTLALVCLILVSAVAGGLAVNPVVAQETPTPDDGTSTDTPEEDESDDEDDDSGESNETDSGDGEDDVVDVEPGDMDGDGTPDETDGQDDESENSNDSGETVTIDFGDVSEVDSSPEEVEPTKIDQDMGGGVHIYDVRWDEDNEEVTFKLRTPRSLNLAITDSNSVDPDATGGHFQQSRLDISRGTYEVTFSATVRGGSQIITITGAPNPTYIQSPDDSGSLFPRNGSRVLAWGSGISSSILLLIGLSMKMNRGDRNKRVRIL